VPEIEGHGLTKILGDLKSLAGVEAETYSNNVGFYNSVFYVFPEQTVAEATNRDGEPATIDIAKTQVSEKRVLQGQTVDISAQVLAENNSASGVTALFYDGDPHAGGNVFGLERIPYIAQDGTYQVEAPYRAAACGKHELFIAVHEGTPDEVLSRIGKIKVDCAYHLVASSGLDSDK
jgi:predicted GNAT family acetyltransferase